MRKLLLLSSLIFVFGFIALAQYEQSAVTGTVSDLQGRPVPDARVLMMHSETGLTRSVISNSAGVFFLNGLPLGTWELIASRQGFASVRLAAIPLAVGQTRTIQLTLPLAQRSEEVTVTAQLSEIDQASAAIGTRMQQPQILELPLNGRNWAAMLPLVAGAVDSGTADQRSVRFAGHGRDDNNFTLDGVDAGGISNQPQKTQVRLAVPTSSISEFKVDSTLFPAETGIGSGAQIVMASTGGTNRFHSDLFEYFRNDVFDARNPFAAQKQPFRLNQFGGNFGGPVGRQKTFFFIAFEAFRQRLDQPLTGFTPSASYRAKLLAQSPALAPAIIAFPAGTAPQSSDANTDIFNGLSPQRADETSGMIRLDHHFNSKVQSFLRVNVDESVVDNPLANLRDRSIADTRPINGVFAISHVVSPSVLNDIRLGFNQVNYRTAQATPTPYTIKVTGFTSVSSSKTKEEDDSSAAIIDNLTLTRGRNTIKAGVEVRRIHTNPGSSSDGTISYTSLNNFAANLLDSASVTATLPLKRLRKTQVFSFLQDEYRVRPNLTLSLGVRYSFFNVFHEAQGRAVPFDFASCGGFCPQGAQFSSPRTHDVDPRVALAWTPDVFQRKTVIRIGAGLYHGDGQMEDQNLPASNDVPRYALSSKTIAGLMYPIEPFLSITTGVAAPLAQNRNRKDEYAVQWSFAVEQEMPAGFTGTITYTGNKGTNLQTITYANVADPVTGKVPYPQFGQVQYRSNESNSIFNAMQLSAARILRAGWLVSANYMWSHAINDGSLGGGETDSVTPQNVFCRACERASSSYDIRHFFTLNSVVRIPYRACALRPVFNGWSLSTIATARSGRPVNIVLTRAASVVPGGYNLTQRPDLIPGVSLAPPGGQTPAHWFNPAAFSIPAPGTWGSAGRNLGRGPALYQIDASLSRHIMLTERLRIELRAEAFNIVNRAQYADPTGDFTVPAQFGIIQSTINTTPVGTGTPRQIQFATRLVF